ncbi:hypothetical protein FRC06_009203 [Ceratobasidium sp. 370]|nr:hypothetical protein FRC06_009203 [Ceratobasidium sp. 370]
MPPSRKRQTTPPSPSPAKRPAAITPDAAPTALPAAPSAKGPVEWSNEFKNCASDCVHGFSAINRPETISMVLNTRDTTAFQPVLGMFALLLVSVADFCTQHDLPMPHHSMLIRKTNPRLLDLNKRAEAAEGSEMNPSNIRPDKGLRVLGRNGGCPVAQPRNPSCSAPFSASDLLLRRDRTPAQLVFRTANRQVTARLRHRFSIPGP